MKLLLSLLMLALACAPEEIVGTPEYFAQMTGVRLELESPARVCRNWTSFPSEGASAFVWDLSAAPLHSSVAAAIEAQAGECEGAAIDPSPAEVLGALDVSPSTLAASMGDERTGAFFAFGPERRVLVEVSYSW